MVFPVVGGTQSTGYDIDNSIRLNDDDSHNISNNPGGGSGSDGSRTQFSISMWVKRSSLGLGDNNKQQFLTSAVATNNFYGTIKFGGNDAIAINLINSGSDQDEIHTDAVFRDVSAWYHLFFVFDKTQAALADGVKLYVNGVLQTFGTTTYTQNQGYHFFRPGKTHYIGNYNGQEGYFDGYMAEVHFVDGSLKAHTDFGEFNDDGVWIPIQYTGSHGTYGFHLEFKQTGTSENSSGMGADTSGNDEHFAVANLAATDITTDTCTNNFATFNPLIAALPASGNATEATFSEGNCKTVTANSGKAGGSSTIQMSSGKWYAEFEFEATNMSGGSVSSLIGVTDSPQLNSNSFGKVGERANDVAYANTGNKLIGDSATSFGNTYTTGDIIGVAVDLDNNAIYFSKNGTFQNSGDPTSGASKTGAIALTAPASTVEGGYFFAVGESHTETSTHLANFGAAYPAAISSGNADANGHGNFEYAVPSGYFALCTKNLGESG